MSVRRLAVTDDFMKNGNRRFWLTLDYWAGAAGFFGAGYVLLSNLKSGVATPIALVLVTIGFIVSIFVRARQKKQSEG